MFSPSIMYHISHLLSYIKISRAFHHIHILRPPSFLYDIHLKCPLTTWSRYLTNQLFIRFHKSYFLLSCSVYVFVFVFILFLLHRFRRHHICSNALSNESNERSTHCCVHSRRWVPTPPQRHGNPPATPPVLHVLGVTVAPYIKNGMRREKGSALICYKQVLQRVNDSTRSIYRINWCTSTQRNCVPRQRWVPTPLQRHDNLFL